MRSLTKFIVDSILNEEEKKKTTAVYGGGFKPPTKGHFEVVEEALRQNPSIDEFIIYVGAKERDGITQTQSTLIWEVYKRSLPMKVTIRPTKTAPIRAIYDYAKEHPQEEVLWIIGARQDNEEDFKDISSRTKSLSKYPNMELRTIITPGGVSGTAARNALKVSKDKFRDFLPDGLTDSEVQEVFDIVSIKESLNEHASYTDSIDIVEKISQLTNHMIDKGMNIEPLPTLEFVDGDSGNASDFLGKTAYYDPENKHIVLYTEGRHPKDIVRSYAHEMIHHIQNLEGRLGDITTTNTQEDGDLDKLEQEANLRGTMTFRNWTDSITGNKLDESIVGQKIVCDNCGWSWNIDDGGDDMFTCHKCGSEDNMPIVEEKTKDPFGLNAYAAELGRLRENEEYKIYLDLDGVVADFDKRFRDLSGMAPSDYESKNGKNAFWDFIDVKHKVAFWVGIPPMPQAKTLVDYVSQHDYEVLTAPSIKKQSVLGKNLWVRNHTGKLFPSKPKVNFRFAKEKHKVKPNLTQYDILIDDKASTIDNWESAGGTGILFTSTPQTT
jgi:5'(3')-deoxyribonucleotidase